MMYDLICEAALKHDIDIAYMRRQSWNIKHMRGPAIEADLDWRKARPPRREAVHGDIWPPENCDVPGPL